MTAEEFLERWPEADRNTNLLVDIACTHCGSRDDFAIDVTCTQYVTDRRIGDEVADDWDRNSYCRCNNCEEDMELRYFTIDGLDKLIKERQEQPKREPQPEDQHFL